MRFRNAFVCCILFVGMLSACGGSATESAPATDQANSEQTTAEEAPSEQTDTEEAVAQSDPFYPVLDDATASETFFKDPLATYNLQVAYTTTMSVKDVLASIDQRYTEAGYTVSDSSVSEVVTIAMGSASGAHAASGRASYKKQVDGKQYECWSMVYKGLEANDTNLMGTTDVIFGVGCSSS